VLRKLESGYDRLDDLLGLRPQRKLDVVVYDPGVFDATFRGLFRFPAAGFYHGVIRVRGDTTVHAGLTRVLHHELVHAAIDAESPSLVLPGWLSEGIAEWFEARAHGKRGLSGAEWRALVAAHRQGRLLPLRALSAPGFGRLRADQAGVAYLQSYALVAHVVDRHGEDALRRFVRRAARTRDVERSLDAIFGSGAADIDAELREALGG